MKACIQIPKWFNITVTIHYCPPAKKSMWKTFLNPKDCSHDFAWLTAHSWIESSLVMSCGPIQWLFWNVELGFILWQFATWSPYLLHCIGAREKWQLLSFLLCMCLIACVAPSHTDLGTAKLFSNWYYISSLMEREKYNSCILCDGYCVSVHAPDVLRHYGMQRTTLHSLSRCVDPPVCFFNLLQNHCSEELMFKVALLHHTLWANTHEYKLASHCQQTRTWSMFNVQCFKGTSISATVDSNAVLLSHEWNSCDYLKMIENIQGLQWPGISFHHKRKGLWR